MIVGAMNKRVSLWKCPTTTPDDDGFFEELKPPLVWAQIQPFAPGGGEDRTTTHLVTIRYHPQVTVDTRVLYGTRQLFVRGVRNVDEDNVSMELLCEEVAT